MYINYSDLINNVNLLDSLLFIQIQINKFLIFFSNQSQTNTTTCLKYGFLEIKSFKTKSNYRDLLQLRVYIANKTRSKNIIMFSNKLEK